MEIKNNQAQEEAIHHLDGPCLVLAGPGSGKTFVITQRTRYLIEEQGVNPSNILVITFTKAAATEMKERFKKLMGDRIVPVTFGTFHAVFFQILKCAYHFNAGNIIREEQRMQFFKELIDQLALEIEDRNEFIAGIMAEISMIKNERIPLESYYSKNCAEEIFRKIYQKYENFLRRANLLDFDDMLVFCYELLKERADILNAWQNKFQYILIDEFQDINFIQYENMRLLAAPRNNLFIVGDDDQSIYRFRGAKPEIMLNFEKDYKNAKRIVLNVNYRSTENVVKAALRLIINNKVRFPKEIVAKNGVGEEITVKSFPGQTEEMEEMIEGIQRHVKMGGSYQDIGILFRTNTQPRLLLEKLMEYQIPFRMRDVIPNLYEHWIAKNIISYVKIACGNRERQEFLQIMNRPKRYFSRESLNQPTVSMEKLYEYYKDKSWMTERICKLEADLKMLSGMIPYAAVHYIRNVVGYEDYLKEYAEYRKIPVEDLLEILEEIQEGAREYQSFDEWFAHIEDYSRELKQQAADRNNQLDGVALSTMHSSKGLEYKVVYIMDANEEITPHRKAVLESDLEEERRLFYVAVTRAKEKLSIFSCKERYGKKLQVSRFVTELLTDLESYHVGASVKHEKFGIGEIRKMENGRLMVYFESSKRIHTFHIEYCVQNQLLKILN